MVNEFEIRKQMCEVGQRVYNRGMVASNDGNFSVKIGPNEILCTPTGVSKGFMTPNMICKVDMEGNVLKTDGIHKPSSEIKMHLRVYKCRPDVNSVVHAHPMYGTAHAICGIPLNKQIMPESTIFLGEVPIAPYGMPSTPEIPDAIEPFFGSYDAVLLENHGALSWGADLMGAYYKMEGLEFYAQLSYVTQMMGGPKELPNNEVQRLVELRKGMNLPGKHPSIDGEAARGCAEVAATTYESKNTCDEDLVARITREVMAHLSK
ncbi:MAG: class II aldolase/adducin family protein [Cellulosilyticaceae bacterium]